MSENQKALRVRMQDDFVMMEQMRKRIQDTCRHMYFSGAPAIKLQHNFPDRQVRGLCMRCSSTIHPRHWEIGTPTPQYPHGQPLLVAPHSFYRAVLLVDDADRFSAILNDVSEAARDSLIAYEEFGLLAELERIIYQARWEIQESLTTDFQNWRATEGKK